METFNIPHSMKDIPSAPKEEYLELLVEKVGKFLKNFKWRAFFLLNEDAKKTERKETYGFNSPYAPPPINHTNYGKHHGTLKAFEDHMYALPRKISESFKSQSNHYQDQLKQTVKKIKECDELIIKADKTKNHYKVKCEEYKKMKQNAVTKEYKHASTGLVEQVDFETAQIAKELGLADRMEVFKQNEAFITLKDHKEGWPSVIKTRLLNPAKSDLGVVAKHILQEIIKKLLTATNLNLWESTDQATKWFNELPTDEVLSFLIYDIENFFPTITEEVLLKALEFAKQYFPIPPEDIAIILQARKSFLFSDGQAWIKKDQNGNLFDVTQGSFDSCQICELVGIYLLSEISKFIPIKHHGLYRDDGLIALPSHGREQEKIRQKLVSLFGNNHFKIEAQVNVKTVAFLDARLNLDKREIRPYRKPNDGPYPRYVHRLSDHPPKLLDSLPEMINNRLNKLSSNEQVFKKKTHSKQH